MVKQKISFRERILERLRAAPALGSFAEHCRAESPESLGWEYQEFMKAARTALIKAKRTYKPADIPAVTQLFTPSWIAEYMAHNTLGKLISGVSLKYLVNGGGENLSPSSLKALDPACGAGHLLLAAYDVLKAGYLAGGYKAAEIPRLILEYNLHGMEIDEAVAEIARAALLMKAALDDETVWDNPPPLNIRVMPAPAGALAQNKETYDAVLVNPPYMGGRFQEPELKGFLKSEYPGFHKDLYSAFIIRSLEYCREGGRLGFMTPFTWMFISSHEKLRRKLLEETRIDSFIQLEYSGFDGATVPICAFSLCKKPEENASGSYIRLSGFRGARMQEPKALEAIKNPACGWRYETRQSDFARIPGAPLAYWVNDKVREAFRQGSKLSELADIKQGLATADNSRFVKLRSQVPPEEMGVKWFPYNKGGKFRKWYGNNQYAVLWENNGEAIKRHVAEKYPYLKGKVEYVVKNEAYYFRESLSWSKVSSGQFCARYYPPGYIFDVAGCSLFPHDRAHIYTLAALLNSSLARIFLSEIYATMNFEVGQVGNFPVLAEYHPTLDKNARELIALAKEEWDSREISPDYKAGHNFNREACLKRMRELEAENDRIALEIYDLSEEMAAL